MTPLRAQMIREWELHRKSSNTVEAYVAAVAQLAQHFGRSPEKIAVEEVRDYLHYLITERKVAFRTCNQKLYGITFLYRHVLGRPDFSLRVPAKRSGRLPEPLGRSEIRQLFAAARNRKHRVLLMTAYGGGFRAGELVRLQPHDIHSARMLIRIDQGKGRKERYTLLSLRLWDELRADWQAYRPQTWLFEGSAPGQHLTAGAAGKLFDQAKARAGIVHGHGMHSLRHSFATHLMEAGVPLPVIQRLLGHSSLTTTAKSLHVTSQHLGSIQSPLDLLRLPQAGEVLEGRKDGHYCLRPHAGIVPPRTVREHGDSGGGRSWAARLPDAVGLGPTHVPPMSLAEPFRPRQIQAPRVASGPNSGRRRSGG